MIPGLDIELGFLEPSPPVGKTRVRRPRFEDELITFLSSALRPTSENSRTSRIDNLIVTAILNDHLSRVTHGAILDVCCGWPLLLEKLIEQLITDKKRTGEYHYVACDVVVSSNEFKRKLKKLENRAQGLLKITNRLTDVSRPEQFKSSLRTTGEEKFDFILLANALHEIPLQARPELLFTLVELLKPRGVLVLLDPEPRWLLDPKRWQEIKQLSELRIDWEAEAVWLPAEVYSSVLRDFGCVVTNFDAPRSQVFWVLQANRQQARITNRKQLIAKASRVMKKALRVQLNEQIERYIDCREGLETALNRTGLTYNKALFLRAVEFFSVSASQAKRLETLRN
jgi:hypothetical protein